MKNNRRGFNTDKLKRIHSQSIRFNTSEIEAIEMYCKKYKIKNKSKFLRETVISKILKQFDTDYPRLF